MKDEIVKKLANIVGEKWIVTKREMMQSYLVDETSPIVRPEPAADIVLVKPSSTQEISSIIKLANIEKIPVFPRGAGTGLVGGAVPTENGIILSMERMNKIEEVDRENLMIVVEGGVSLGELLKATDEADLLFPPHPGDEAAQVGALVACNAGGARAVKYGVLRNYVKGIEVVLPTGDILNLKGKLLKNVTGYDLMQLLIGSEGTLGIITKVILRLYPKFKASASLIVSYDDRHEAINTVPKILQEGITPLALEYVEKELIEKSADHLGKEWPAKKGKAFLYIIVTGESEEEVYSTAEKIDEICRDHKAIDTLIAERRKDQEDILSIRSNIYTALKSHTSDILDIAVPPANIGKLLDKLDKVAEKYDMYLPVYGHAADGNMHPQLLNKKGGGVREQELEKVAREIYDAASGLGGVITAEHGIGKIRIKNLNQSLSFKEIELMKGIKKVFDPNNILNPGTVVPKE